MNVEWHQIKVLFSVFLYETTYSGVVVQKAETICSNKNSGLCFSHVVQIKGCRCSNENGLCVLDTEGHTVVKGNVHWIRGASSCKGRRLNSECRMLKSEIRIIKTPVKQGSSWLHFRMQVKQKWELMISVIRAFDRAYLGMLKYSNMNLRKQKKKQKTGT